jgi:hypothetical protein
MVWQAHQGLDEYFQSTGLCDCDSVAIRGKDREITEDAADPQEAATKIFYHVRDQIQFGMDHCDVKASDTLRKGIGFCITRTNPQVALLRAVSIPARYHQGILSKDSLKGIIPTFGHKFTPDRIWWHPWCECYLSERWIPCDTLLDKRLYDSLLNKGRIRKGKIPTIDWDGVHDLNTMTQWLLEDVGPADSMDQVFKKVQKEVLPPRIIAGILFRISNRYTNRLRVS